MKTLSAGLPLKSTVSGGANPVLHRLRIYTKETGFLGLLYFVPDSATLDGLTHIYSSSGTKESLRIRSIQNLFLATALVPTEK